MMFKTVEISDYHRLSSYFIHQRYELSLYSLSSMIAWRNGGGYRLLYCEQDGLLWFVACHDKSPEKSHLVMPVGGREPSLHELDAMMKAAEVDQVWFIPEQFIIENDIAINHGFLVEEAEMYHDYIYRTADLADLPGKILGKKRNLIHQFEKEYLATGRAQVADLLAIDANECLLFLEKWCIERDCEGVGKGDTSLLGCEKKAIYDLVLAEGFLGARGVVIRIDGVFSGFGIAAYLTDTMATLCFEKAFAAHKGLYQYLDRECVRRLFVGHYEYINKESDMGEAGLKKAKLSYNPLKIVKSFQITKR